MPHKFDPREKHLLLSDEREAALQPEKLLRKLGLRAGDTMADIGCGPGFFTLPAARIVGRNGIVLAGDIQGEMLTSVRGRAHEAELGNVRVVKTSETEIPLPAESFDFVLLAFVLNELEHRATFLHRAARLLKPTGRVVVLEWERAETPSGPPLEDRVSRDELVEDALAAGLKVKDDGELGDGQYYYVFGRTTRERVRDAEQEAVAR
ncbi:MAG TPA: methyltransferase domain-containing protein [Ktedonobacterales bacterium]